jgi:hypothetical protein
MLETGTLLWFLAILGGTTVLGVAFAFAIAQWRHRDRRLDPIREEATRELYAEEERRAEEQDVPAPSVRRTSNAA